MENKKLEVNNSNTNYGNFNKIKVGLTLFFSSILLSNCVVVPGTTYRRLPANVEYMPDVKLRTNQLTNSVIIDIPATSEYYRKIFRQQLWERSEMKVLECIAPEYRTVDFDIDCNPVMFTPYAESITAKVSENFFYRSTRGYRERDTSICVALGDTFGRTRNWSNISDTQLYCTPPDSVQRSEYNDQQLEYSDDRTIRSFSIDDSVFRAENDGRVSFEASFQGKPPSEAYICRREYDDPNSYKTTDEQNCQSGVPITIVGSHLEGYTFFDNSRFSGTIALCFKDKLLNQAICSRDSSISWSTGE